MLLRPRLLAGKDARDTAASHFTLRAVMEFMLVCYNDEKHWESLARSEQDRIVADCVEYAEGLRKSGHLRSSGRLQPARGA